MVQSYLRHGPTQAFGLVCSSSSNSVYDGKLAYVPALEDILVWDVKKGQMLAMWHETGHRAEVTCILRSPQKDQFAVGYADGSIRLWSSSTGSVITTFNGHKKAVSALAFDEEGARLASGSQDTDLIVWDIVAEAGLYRLRGHRDQITAIKFIPTTSDVPSTSTAFASVMLLTASKDTFMKLWDLSTQHCIQTIVAHRSDIWAMDVNIDRNIIFTGSGEGEIKAWSISAEAISKGLTESDSGDITKIIHPIAALPLSSRHRVSQISFHPTQPFLAVQSHDRSVEVFRIRTEEEVHKKQMRRKKRAKEKKDKQPNSVKDEDDVEDAEEDSEISLVALFTPHVIVRATKKIRSFAFGADNPGVKDGIQIMAALSSNSLEVYNVPPPSKSKDPLEATCTYTVELPGHRNDVRTLCLSSDDQLLASASNDSLKIWNMKTTACIRTIGLLVYDVASSSLIETIKAHTATVWSLHVRADGEALVTGSADKDVKFWEFEQKDAGENSTQSGKLLTLVHLRTLKMTDDVLSVKYSPDGKFLAVALLDSTVKVFYQDSLKFFLSLYGHKLPVLGMDISSDSKLIVTCSADKNVKIWGLDFGDCHKSIFAHEESVMQVLFENDSHYFWTVGKDKMLKYWDGDKFENIQRLEGHHGEVWALALSHFGKFVVTGSHDKSIRVWEKLDDPLFLEEEREKELEALYDSGAVDALNRRDLPIGSGVGDGVVDSSAVAEATGVSKQTTETLMAGERIMEALDLADAERTVFREYEEAMSRLPEDDAMRLQPPPRNPVLAAYDMEPETYVLKVVEKVQSTALHDALLALPFGKNWNIILVSRIIFFLLKTHHHQIVANRIMRTHLRAALQRQKEVIGYNLAALQYIRRRDQAERVAHFFEDEASAETVRLQISEGKKRNESIYWLDLGVRKSAVVI
ncbi:WD40 repeat-like protein [Gymnopus androsaceus JB14]|uniref:WD40 repeat-like protein n=1 Tax=Gymnopus androsaceus JB14 TaxID=1447944 RepID=A0A6A4IIQ4_9AGAR|nr:WD40 repeat-like protein [Gymnopus androsaceus JB14]